MAREDLHFRLRIPEELKTRIEESANADHRSMTAEIVSRLERSFLGDLSLPPSLYARIKAYASRQGRSANDEIVRILEREFPEPWTMDGRISELLGMVEILKAGATTDERIEHLASEFEETVLGVITGRIRGINEETRRSIKHAWDLHQEREYEMERDNSRYDEGEEISMGTTGRTEKFVEPDFPDHPEKD